MSMNHGNISTDIARGLKALKERIKAANIPPSTLDESINLATWNVREFGNTGDKARSKASLHYIAEVVGQFDLVAMVEVRDDLTEMSRVMNYLGPYWNVIFSDYIADAGGNHERIAYLYDSRAVHFTGLASQISPKRTKKGTEYSSQVSWWRPPYMASFRAGNFDFVLLSAHIRWDAQQGEKSRAQELQLLADWIATRQKEPFVVDQDLIVMGDFNVPDTTGPLFQAITSKGLKMPDALAGLHGSNLAQDKRYDQILHFPQFSKSFTHQGGVLDFFRGDFKPLYPESTKSKDALTYEMSDHLPLWIHVNTDTDAERLDQILNPKNA
jgi:endonuclease/exonuclease/phosphatase family metal-dependent hydrolase